MKNWNLLCLLATLPFPSFAFAVESEARLQFYKGGEHSSHAHLMITGAAAKDLFLHLSQAQERNDATQKIIVRKGTSLECVYFYGESSLPYRCYLHLDETGLLKAGYAPSN